MNAPQRRSEAQRTFMLQSANARCIIQVTQHDRRFIMPFEKNGVEQVMWGHVMCADQSAQGSAPSFDGRAQTLQRRAHTQHRTFDSLAIVEMRT